MENSPNHAQFAHTGAGGQPPASDMPLHKKHDDLDILQGCPRSLLIGGIPVKVKAFLNDDFTRIGVVLVYYGFKSCETPEEVENITIDEIYTNLVLNSTPWLLAAGYESVQQFLLSFIQWPDDKAPDADISDEDFRRFLAVLIEQNSLSVYAKKNVKRTLREEIAKASKT
jgi:hypothetical protein